VVIDLIVLPVRRFLAAIIIFWLMSPKLEAGIK